jgi:hypothetical protein
MAIVTEISWDDMLDGKPLPDNPDLVATQAKLARPGGRKGAFKASQPPKMRKC